jgi:hypothetical protein
MFTNPTQQRATPAISLIWEKIPCSGGENSLFADYQGMAPQALGELAEFHEFAPQTGAKRPNFQEIP